MSYYSNINVDLLNAINAPPIKVLEIGCGEGWFGKKVKELYPECIYHGVELFPDAAKVAQDNIDEVRIGNIEDPNVMDGVQSGYDLLVFGDVLEHLVDPWATLKALKSRTAEQSTCVACIPNVAHWSMIARLLSGQWTYENAGLLDRTHLRFFTVETMIKMFQDAGWGSKIEAKPRILWPEKTAAHLEALLPAAKLLGIDEKQVVVNARAFQWVLRAECH